MFPEILSALAPMVLLATRSPPVVANLVNASLIRIAQTLLRVRTHVARIHVTKIPMVVVKTRSALSALTLQYAHALQTLKVTHTLSAESLNAPTTMIAQAQSLALTRIASIHARYRILVVKTPAALSRTTLAYVHVSLVTPETRSLDA